MGTEYVQTLEEELQDLEAENSLLAREIERVTDQMDEMQERITEQVRAEYEARMSKINAKLMEELGVVKSSTQDIEMNMSMLLSKIVELRSRSMSSSARDMRGRVRIVLEDTYKPVQQMDYLFEPYETHGGDAYMYYDLTIDELVEDHRNMMRALKSLAHQYAMETRVSPSTVRPTDQIIDRLCEVHNLKVLPHNKKRN